MHLLATLQFKTCAPTFIPSPILPQLTSITKLKTPPRNLRDLFDFAAAGPIVGMLASAALLVYGAAETNAMDAASYAMLPSLPLELIKSSSLGANILNSLMGNQLLIQNAPSIVPLHPTAIAGFCGLIVNALSLLPIGRKLLDYITSSSCIIHCSMLNDTSKLCYFSLLSLYAEKNLTGGGSPWPYSEEMDMSSHHFLLILSSSDQHSLDLTLIIYCSFTVFFHCLQTENLKSLA